jgi:hypothetical protein
MKFSKDEKHLDNANNSIVKEDHNATTKNIDSNVRGSRAQTAQLAKESATSARHTLRERALRSDQGKSPRPYRRRDQSLPAINIGRFKNVQVHHYEIDPEIKQKLNGLPTNDLFEIVDDNKAEIFREIVADAKAKHHFGECVQLKDLSE